MAEQCIRVRRERVFEASYVIAATLLVIRNHHDAGLPANGVQEPRPFPEQITGVADPTEDKDDHYRDGRECGARLLFSNRLTMLRGEKARQEFIGRLEWGRVALEIL